MNKSVISPCKGTVRRYGKKMTTNPTKFLFSEHVFIVLRCCTCPMQIRRLCICKLPHNCLDVVFERARREKERFKENWQTVNINEFVQKFTPGAKGIISKDGRKIYYYNKHNSLRITTDVAGGYCRLEDTSKKGRERFLDINGNDARNYINERGKLQGRSPSQFNEVTHFRILKRKEM